MYAEAYLESSRTSMLDWVLDTSLLWALQRKRFIEVTIYLI